MLQNPENMSYDSTTEAHWRPYTASVSATNTSIITVVVGLYSSDGRAVCITQLGLFPKSSFVLSPTQNRQFFRSCGKWVGEVSLNRLHVASKIKKKKITKYCASFLVVGGLRCSNLSFTTDRMTQHAPDY